MVQTMKSIKLSTFIRNKIEPFILGAFLSRFCEESIDNKSYFYTYTSFKKSQFVINTEFDFLNYAHELAEVYNQKTGYDNWVIYKSTNNQTELRFYLYNDVNIDHKWLFRTLMQKFLSSEWANTYDLNSEKRMFFIGFIETRGSIDTKAKYISQDYYYSDCYELKRANLIVTVLGVDYCFVNFNSRELQPQYVAGITKRNTQFRVDLFYYLSVFGLLNKYKAKIFENSYIFSGKKIIDDVITYNLQYTIRSNQSFINSLNFYTNSIYNKQIDKKGVNYLRKLRGLDSTTDASNKRNKSIIEIFKMFSERKCAVCGTTHTYKDKNGNEYFEVHHVISRYNGGELDNIQNLVYLCPNCHRLLKKNGASKEDQLKAIYNILFHNPNVYEFASSYLNIYDDLNELTEKIQSMLG